jgi:hypothetical protein
VARNIFVGLARLVFLFRVGLAQLFLRVVLLGSPVGLSQFLFERREKKSFVQLALLIILFPVVLAQLFVGVGLLGVSRWTCVFFFFLRWQEKRGVEFALWLMFC